MKTLTAFDRLVAKHALETLDTVAAGLAPGILYDQVERMVGQKIDDQKRLEITNYMREREWVYTYTDKLCGMICLAVRQSGILASAAL